MAAAVGRVEVVRVSDAVAEEAAAAAAVDAEDDDLVAMLPSCGS